MDACDAETRLTRLPIRTLGTGCPEAHLAKRVPCSSCWGDTMQVSPAPRGGAPEARPRGPPQRPPPGAAPGATSRGPPQRPPPTGGASDRPSGPSRRPPPGDATRRRPPPPSNPPPRPPVEDDAPPAEAFFALIESRDDPGAGARVDGARARSRARAEGRPSPRQLEPLHAAQLARSISLTPPRRSL